MLVHALESLWRLFDSEATGKHLLDVEFHACDEAEKAAIVGIGSPTISVVDISGIEGGRRSSRRISEIRCRLVGLSHVKR